MSNTMTQTRGYVLNRAESAMSFLRNRLEDISSPDRRNMERVLETIMALYQEIYNMEGMDADPTPLLELLYTELELEQNILGGM